MKIHYHFALFLSIVFVIGCGGDPSVSGTVTFPDGSPLDHGEVIFETSAMMAKGNIQKDGTYTMSTSESKGVPKGSYAVSIGGYVPRTIEPERGPDGRPLGSPQFIPVEIPIAEKYLNPSTSGLTCDVKGNTKFDIKVEKP